MDNQTNNDSKQAVKYWWVSLLLGAMAIIMGIWCFLTPDITLIALTYLFVTVFFVAGIFEIIFSVSNRRNISGWGWSLAGGILEILLAILIISMPVPLITGTLILFVGFWVLFRSIWMIGESIDIKRSGIGGWGVLLFLAILGILFSFVFFFSPVRGGAFTVLFLSISFIIYGIFRISLAFRLRSSGTKKDKE